MFKRNSKLKKVLLFIIPFMLLVSCTTPTLKDFYEIKKRGTINIGITYFEPINYKDSDGNLKGFDTEFAKLVCRKLNIEPIFSEIDWDSKEIELNSKKIDCIWNGFAITSERDNNMRLSTPYMKNFVVMIAKKNDIEKYNKKENLVDKIIVAEKGSQGATICETDEFFSTSKPISTNSQVAALMEVASGTADVAVCDSVMANPYLKKGSDFENLALIESRNFDSEQYAIAFRKSDEVLAQKINEIIEQIAASGELKKIAEKYGLEQLLLVG